MLRRLIDFSLDHRWTTLVLVGLLLAGGLALALRTPIDAFPDLTNNQVVVITEAPAMPPEEVEKLVTFPIETAVMGLPRTEEVRSISKLGLSVVTLIFEDGVPTYFARQLVNERLQEVRSRLPEGLEPTLGPVATAFGEVYQYTIENEITPRPANAANSRDTTSTTSTTTAAPAGDSAIAASAGNATGASGTSAMSIAGDAAGASGMSLMDRKTLHDWQIRYDLRTVPGVNEVNSWGGDTKQYEIEVDPDALQRYSLTLRDIFLRVQENNRNFGGGFIEHAEEQYTVRGLGRAATPDDLEHIVLLAHQGTPVLLRDVATVRAGAVPRQGAVLRDGKGETVSGMAIMLKGDNGRRVIQRVKEKIASLTLPGGARIVPFYDQSTVIDGTMHTVGRNLLEAGVLVIGVLLLFLGNFRAACLVALVIPCSMLFGFMGMAVYGISANLMSLGAIDFGMVVDGAVVMMENSVRHAAMGQSGPGGAGGSGAAAYDPREAVRAAAHEVARPIVFAVAIIIAVYLPILTLEGLEGRMFRPMAITVCSLLIGSLLLALTAVPALASFTLGRGVREHHEEGWFERLRLGYARSLRAAGERRPLVLAIATAAVAVAVGSLMFIGTEFMPRLDEGSVLITTKKLPGIALSDSVALSEKIEKIVLEFPEVTSVVTKLGRPDLATEAMGVYEADVYVLLKPIDEWTTARTKPALIDKMAARLEQVPGVIYNFTQPMAMRLDEVVSGIKADVAVKIFGEDAAVLEQLADRALRVLSAIPGAADAQAEVLSGVAELRVKVDRAALARYGLNVTDVQALLDSTTGGTPVSELVEGQRRFPIVVRLPARYRSDLHALGTLLLQAPGGERVRLNQVADISVARGPEIVSRERASRRIVVQANVRGTDLGSFVSDARAAIERDIALPPGYSMAWGGQFENQQRATRRLAVVLPISVAVIFGLLVATFGSSKQAFLILLNVPFALVGGIAALWLRGLNLNVSASIGFIALFGVAVLNGIVMVSYINRLVQDGLPQDEAVHTGAAMRLRAVLMTALVASLGFVPMAFSQAIGAEVQRPLATVVIGGLITSTILTLYVLPLLYPWFSPRIPGDAAGTAGAAGAAGAAHGGGTAMALRAEQPGR